jgi:hypothetical protein
LTYGWSASHAGSAVDRNLNASQLLDTRIAVQAGQRWDLVVPTGTYTVTVGVGDAGAASTHNVWVEGKSLFSFVNTAADQFLARTITVPVSDGRLTIGVGSAADLATRLTHLVVVPA